MLLVSLILSLNCLGQNLYLDALFCLIITHAFLSDWSDYDPMLGLQVMLTESSVTPIDQNTHSV